MPTTMPWTAADLRAWRQRLGWTQAQAADSLCYHLQAFKKLELGTRPIVERIKRMSLLIERERARALISTSGSGVGRQVFATASATAARMDILRREGHLHRADGSARIRYLSLFSGLEAATAALERIGSDAVAVGYAEIDPTANAVLRHRWPDVPRLGDVTAVDWSELRGHVDIMVGGPPCQSFSVAGRRLGLGDPRGNLALHYLRAVGAIQPEYVLLENVPGILNANGGDDFEALLIAVAELGYACSWRLLDAQHFGLPQRRKRLWLVARRGGSARGPEQVLALDDGEGGRAPAGRGAWQAATRRAAPGAGELTDIGGDWSEEGAWLDSREEDPVSFGPAIAPRPGSVVAFQPGQSTAARSDGVSLTVAPTLTSAGGGNAVPAIAYAADLRHGTLGDVASTLQVGPVGGWSLNAMPVAVHPTADQEWIVRRFTPRECLRLQGLDDDWLDGVRVGGKPLSDTEQYALIGNAWAVPCAAWVLERILAMMESDRSMAAQATS